MNKTIAAYLANVATAAEHAPYGTPGLFQMNAFFNNSLVWAANSVATAQIRCDAEPTADNDEKLAKANVRLHTVKALYVQYADEVAIPQLELPHVERFMGLDKEPDVTEIQKQANNAAKAAVRNALMAGRNPQGVYAKTYATKTAAMAKVREDRRAQLMEVYTLVHTEAGITGNSFDYLWADAGIDFAVTVGDHPGYALVSSVRDSLESFQSYRVDFTLMAEPFGLGYRLGASLGGVAP